MLSLFLFWSLSMSLLFEVKNTYDFVTYAPAKLGGAFKIMKVLGILDLASAMHYRDVVAIHSIILPDLPPGTPADPNSLTYIRFRDAHDEESVFAYEWIDAGSISAVSSVNLRIEVYGASTTDVSTIRDALTLAGIASFSITQV